MRDYNEDRYGSASWATYDQIQRAGLFSGKGQYIGHFAGRPMHLPGVKSVFVAAGAGAGKGTGLVIPMIIDLKGRSRPISRVRNAIRRWWRNAHKRKQAHHAWINDPKGELAAVTFQRFAEDGDEVRVWNPFGLHADIGLPQDRMNVFEGLTPDNTRLAANCRLFAESLVVLSGGGASQYFEIEARDMYDALLQVLVERDGYVTLQTLFTAINALVGDAKAFDSLLTVMENSRSEFVRTAAKKWWLKRKDAPKEFFGVQSTAAQKLGFMADYRISDATAASDFYLRDQAKDDGISRIYYFVCPAEYLEQLAPIIRMAVTATFLAKSAAPQSPMLTMIIDECAQLGRFEMIPRMVTYARGLKIKAVLVYQDFGQVENAFGRTGMQSILGSCPVRIMFGIREPHGAGYASDFMGTQTITVDHELQQRNARYQADDIVRSFLNGEDPMTAANSYQRLRLASEQQQRMARKLMTPDEIMGMKTSEMIISIADLNIDTILGEKVNYYDRPEFNGLYQPNPLHGATDHVLLPTFWGTRRHEVVIADVPDHLAHLPQYRQTRKMRFVEGYKPW